MPLTIPDEAVTLYAPQSAPDSTDMDAVVAAVGASGVISGCAVSAQAAPNMTVAVAAGTISSAGIPVGVAAVASLTIGAASPTDRRDLVVVDALGTVSVVAGTPGGALNGSTPSGSRDPVKPAIPAGSVLLAEVYVAAQDTTVATGNITDKRVVIGDAISVAGRRGAVTLTAADIGAGTFPAGTFSFTGDLKVQSAGVDRFTWGVVAGAATQQQIYGKTGEPAIIGLVAPNTTDYADFTYDGSNADIDVTHGDLNLRPLSATGNVTVWSTLGNAKLRVGSQNFGAALDLKHDGSNAHISAVGGNVQFDTATQFNNDVTAHGNLVLDNTKAVYWNMSSGNQSYIAGNGTNLLLRGGASGVVLRNNADTANTLVVDDSGNMFFNNAHGANFAMSSGNGGYILASGATLSIRGGSGGLVVRNNADAASTLAIDDSGAMFPARGMALPESGVTTAGTAVPGLSFRTDGAAFTDIWSLHGTYVHAYGLTRYAYDDGTGTGLGGNLSISGWGGLSLNTGNVEVIRINGGDHHIHSKFMLNADAGATIPSGTWLQWSGGTGTPYISLAANGWFVVRMGASGFIFESNDATTNPATWTNGGDLSTNGFVKAGSRLNVYDDYSGLVGGASKRATLYAYHGLEIRGGRAAATVPTPAAGSAGADASLYVYPGSSGQIGLVIQGLAGQNVELQQWMDSAGTVIGRFYSDGNFQVRGVNAQLSFYDRGGSATQSYTWYSSGNVARLWEQSTGFDVLNVSQGQLVVLSGASTAISSLGFARGAGVEYNIAVASAGGQFFSDVGAGDSIVRVVDASKYLRLGTGTGASTLVVSNNGVTVTGGAGGAALTLLGTTVGIEHGALGVSNSPFYDWHSSATNNDYDVRFQASSGGSVVGLGNMSFYLNGLFVTQTSVTGASGSVLQINGNATYNGRGAEIAMVDSKGGQATPNKYVRAMGGQLQVVNSAYTSTILTLDDSGNLTTTGVINDNSGRVYSPGNKPPGAVVQSSYKDNFNGGTQWGLSGSVGQFYNSAYWIQVSNSVTITCGASGVIVLESSTQLLVQTTGINMFAAVVPAVSVTDAGNATQNNSGGGAGWCTTGGSGMVAQTPVVITSTRVRTGLTPGTSYTFANYAMASGSSQFIYTGSSTNGQSGSVSCYSNIVAITY